MYDKENQQSWWDRMKHTYRLVIMNNETFEEKGSYKLTLLNVYIVVSTILVVFFVIVFSLVAYTPLRKYIPGYGDGNMDKEVLALTKELDALEKEFNAQKAYADNFRKMLVGDVTTEEDIDQEVEPMAPDSSLNITPSENEQSLRNEIDLKEVGEAAKKGRATNLNARDVPLEQLFFLSPINGEISAGFMPDKKHYGVDVLAPKNTAIKAVMDGYVFISDWTLETGNTIGIQHANNIITFYKHNSALLKKVGSFVKAGEAVAIIGNTGTLSSGPHLHFELWHRGQPIDPTAFIQF
jgi:murein DD-endopeptidase MepM/ murein hydrolase activator NlpD